MGTVSVKYGGQAVLTALSVVQDSLFVLEVVADESRKLQEGRGVRFRPHVETGLANLSPDAQDPSATREPSELCQRITRETLDLKLSCCAFEGHVER